MTNSFLSISVVVFTLFLFIHFIEGASNSNVTNSGTASTTTTNSANVKQGNKIFSYYYYSSTGIQPQDIACDKVSHLIWAFANILSDGTVTLNGPKGSDALYNAISKPFPGETCNCNGTCLKGELNQMFLLKRRCSHMKLILSIGGWVWSSNFSIAFSNENSRRNAYLTSTKLMETYGFDGLDIDWEFPATPRDKVNYPTYTSNPALDIANFAAFLKETRNYWTSINKSYLLTAALPAFVVQPTNPNWSILYSNLDYGFIMSYEFHHNQIRTRPGAPWKGTNRDSMEEIANTVSAGLKTYFDIGFPASKMILGLPLYAVGWKNLDPKFNYGSELPGMKYPLASSTASLIEPIPYNQLVQQQKNYQSIYDQERVSQIYFNGTTVLFSETPDTVQLKAKYSKQLGLPGVMLWNSNQDTNDSKSLLTALSKELPIVSSKLASSFCLSTTEFCNLRCDYDFSSLTNTNGNSKPSSTSTSTSSNTSTKSSPSSPSSSTPTPKSTYAPSSSSSSGFSRSNTKVSSASSSFSFVTSSFVYLSLGLSLLYLVF